MLICACPGFYRVGIEFGYGEMDHFNAVNFKPKFFVKNLGIEVRSALACDCLPSSCLVFSLKY